MPQFRTGVSMDAVGAGYTQSIPEVDASLRVNAKSPADLACENIDGVEAPGDNLCGLSPCCYETIRSVLGHLMSMPDKDVSLLFHMMKGGSRTEWADSQGISKQAASTRFAKMKARWSVLHLASTTQEDLWQ